MSIFSNISKKIIKDIYIIIPVIVLGFLVNQFYYIPKEKELRKLERQEKAFRERIIDYDNIVIVDEIAYYKHDMSLVTGNVKDYDGRRLMSSEYWKDGRRVGIYKEWYYSGQLMLEGNYKNGKKDGLWTEWEKDGRLKYRRNYKDGIEQQ